MPSSIDCGESVDICIKVAEMCTIKLGKVESATPSQSNESTMEIDNRAYTKMVGSNCLTVHYFEISLDVSGWDASDGSVECLTIS